MVHRADVAYATATLSPAQLDDQTRRAAAALARAHPAAVAALRQLGKAVQRAAEQLAAAGDDGHAYPLYEVDAAYESARVAVHLRLAACDYLAGVTAEAQRRQPDPVRSEHDDAAAR